MAMQKLTFVFCILVQTVVGQPPLCDYVNAPLTGPNAPLGNATNNGWYCAKNYTSTMYKYNPTLTDSCFCIAFKPGISIMQAWSSCAAVGGFLADIRDGIENDLMQTLVGYAANLTTVTPNYPLWIGEQKQGPAHTWNRGCTSKSVVYTNYNYTSENNAGSFAAYTYDANKQWSANNDPINGVANGFICRKDQNPCAVGAVFCTYPATCTVTKSNCGLCVTPTTTGPATTTKAGLSSAVPFCDSSRPDGGWWCAVDYPIGQNVSSAVDSDSCFCYAYKNQTVAEATQACSTMGGYLSDVRNAAESDLLVGLVYDVMYNAPAVQLPPCPLFWTMWQGSCYRVFPNITYWQRAEDYCVSLGSHLPSIHSDAEYNFMVDLGLQMQSAGMAIPPYGIWVGGTNTISGTYQWSDGTPWDYDPPVGICLATQEAMAATNPPLYMGLKLDIPCAHKHFNDTMNVFCKITPTLYPMWIGYQKTATYEWNRVCEVNPAGGFNRTLSSTLSPAAYIFNADSTWSAVDPTTTIAKGAMCRKDRNPCGDSNCTLTQLCVNTTAPNCFYCIDANATTTTTTVPVTTTTTGPVTTTTTGPVTTTTTGPVTTTTTGPVTTTTTGPVTTSTTGPITTTTVGSSTTTGTGSLPTTTSGTLTTVPITTGSFPSTTTVPLATGGLTTMSTASTAIQATVTANVATLKPGSVRFVQAGCPDQTLSHVLGVVDTRLTNVPTLMECGELCITMSTCLAINYNAQTAVCETLNNNTTTQPLICDPGWSCYERFNL